MTHDHREAHSLFPEYWIPHSTLSRLDEDGEDWECPFCGCPHKVMEIDDDTVSFVALESRECWKSFEEECGECGEVYKCAPGCVGKENLEHFLSEVFEDEEEVVKDALLIWTDADPGETLQVPGGLPMWGGPFDA